MKVLFYGTPEFALPTLDALVQRHEVVTVVTQPDRPAHRGQRLTPPPVKLRALGAGLRVIQPPRLRDPGWDEQLRALGADIAVVVAFGQILPRPVLDAPARGSINVHASLLPRYRGAAPIAWAIMRGETTTGVTTFVMNEGMDTGDVLLTRATPIGPDETAGELAARLSRLGAEVLIETLDELDTLKPASQDHASATLAPRLRKSDGVITWSRPAHELVNQVRGCNPWPGAMTRTPRGLLTIWRATATPRDTGDEPGTLVKHEGALAVASAQGLVMPTEVQPQNRRAISWKDWLAGARLTPGERYTAP
jgi:methionyl-tRNA formyltransferase